MQVRDLIQRVQTAEFLSPAERIAWLKKMPKMEMRDLAALASVFDWLDAQKARMEKEKEQLMNIFKLCLAGMNKEAVKLTKKEAIEKMEADFEEMEAFNLDENLNSV